MPDAKMAEIIPLPTWVVVVAGALSLWAILDHLLIPGARWFFRRRASRVIDELNTRLQLQIPLFQRTKRQVLIDRLTYDPKVMESVEAEAQRSDVPREALIREVERYAREIVPSFNVYLYFRFGYYLARRILQFLYRVRLGYADDEALARIEPTASIVFLMNHRSNMDYIIVAYMAATRSALSYAVGEWARTWPLQSIIKSLGGFFVRRKSDNPLYRRVLARYVQMATAGGVVQAFYPEGRFTRDGRLRKPRLGLISYMVSAFDPEGERDLVFIPVGINYDRVLEDRSLVRDLDPQANPRSKTYTVVAFLRFLGHQVKLLLERRWYRFGYACVNFGTPVSMRSYIARTRTDFRALDAEARFGAVERLGNELLDAIATAIPVLPVPLIATVFLRHPQTAMSELEIKAQTHALINDLEQRGAYVHIPRADHDYATTVGLRMLVLRHLVQESDGLYRACATEHDMLRYYANSIAHFLPEP